MEQSFQQKMEERRKLDSWTVTHVLCPDEKKPRVLAVIEPPNVKRYCPDDVKHKTLYIKGYSGSNSPDRSNYEVHLAVSRTDGKTNLPLHFRKIYECDSKNGTVNVKGSLVGDYTDDLPDNENISVLKSSIKGIFRAWSRHLDGMTTNYVLGEVVEATKISETENPTWYSMLPTYDKYKLWTATTEAITFNRMNKGVTLNVMKPEQDENKEVREREGFYVNEHAYAQSVWCFLSVEAAVFTLTNDMVAERICQKTGNSERDVKQFIKGAWKNKDDPSFDPLVFDEGKYEDQKIFDEVPPPPEHMENYEKDKKLPNRKDSFDPEWEPSFGKKFYRLVANELFTGSPHERKRRKNESGEYVKTGTGLGLPKLMEIVTGPGRNLVDLIRKIPLCEVVEEDQCWLLEDHRGVAYIIQCLHAFPFIEGINDWKLGQFFIKYVFHRGKDSLEWINKLIVLIKGTRHNDTAYHSGLQFFLIEYLHFVCVIHPIRRGKALPSEATDLLQMYLHNFEIRSIKMHQLYYHLYATNENHTVSPKIDELAILNWDIRKRFIEVGEEREKLLQKVKDAEKKRRIKDEIDNKMDKEMTEWKKNHSEYFKSCNREATEIPETECDYVPMMRRSKTWHFRLYNKKFMEDEIKRLKDLNSRIRILGHFYTNRDNR